MQRDHVNQDFPDFLLKNNREQQGEQLKYINHAFSIIRRQQISKCQFI